MEVSLFLLRLSTFAHGNQLKVLLRLFLGNITHKGITVVHNKVGDRSAKLQLLHFRVKKICSDEPISQKQVSKYIHRFLSAVASIELAI